MLNTVNHTFFQAKDKPKDCANCYSHYKNIKKFITFSSCILTFLLSVQLLVSAAVHRPHALIETPPNHLFITSNFISTLFSYIRQEGSTF